MSTKRTIRGRQREGDRPGYHLFDDVHDEFAASDDDAELPLYLQLDGVVVQLETLDSGGATVTVRLPRELALELGLLGDRRKPGTMPG